MLCYHNPHCQYHHKTGSPIINAIIILIIPVIIITIKLVDIVLFVASPKVNDGHDAWIPDNRSYISEFFELFLNSDGATTCCIGQRWWNRRTVGLGYHWAPTCMYTSAVNFLYLFFSLGSLPPLVRQTRIRLDSMQLLFAQNCCNLIRCLLHRTISDSKVLDRQLPNLSFGCLEFAFHHLHWLYQSGLHWDSKRSLLIVLQIIKSQMSNKLFLLD